MARHRKPFSLSRSLGLRAAVLVVFLVVVAGAGSAYEVVPSAAGGETASPSASASVASSATGSGLAMDPALRRAFDIRYGLQYVTPPVLGPFLPQWTLAERASQIEGAVVPNAFPPVPENTGEGRRIVYDKSDQRIWLISETGRVIDSYLVSGRLSEPRPGTYRVYSKSPNAVAFYQGITMKWMVRFAYGSVNGISIGFHDLPLYADGTPMMTEDQFGTPLSGGCVRQPDVKARSLYGWADIGTVVVVQP